MSEDDRKQEKMEVLYEIEELNAEMGCVRSKLLGAKSTFQELTEALPKFATPEPHTTPGTLRIKAFPSPDELQALVARLARCREEMANLDQRKAMLYPAR